MPPSLLPSKEPPVTQLAAIPLAPSTINATPRKRVLAVASGGGHWIQLLRMMPAFKDHNVTYVSTFASCRDMVPYSPFHTVRDANLNDKRGLLKMAWQLTKIIDSLRPDIIISTGAAPGYFALRIGRVFLARTIWVDSIANADVLSTSGTKVGKYVDLWLTQWPHLARPDGPHYFGAVL